MADFTITHRIEAPALVDALNNLAAALSGGPVAATPAADDKPVTFDDIVAAVSQLLDAGRMGDLLNLLKGFGVQAITQLKPEQFPEVAVALRGLGAKI